MDGLIYSRQRRLHYGFMARMDESIPSGKGGISGKGESFVSAVCSRYGGNSGKGESSITAYTTAMEESAAGDISPYPLD